MSGDETEVYEQLKRVSTNLTCKFQCVFQASTRLGFALVLVNYIGGHLVGDARPAI